MKQKLFRIDDVPSFTRLPLRNLHECTDAQLCFGASSAVLVRWSPALVPL